MNSSYEYINEKEKLYEENDYLRKENARLYKLARKMHLWIFLNSGDEEAIYKELGLTDEDNEMLGYGGKFTLKSKGDE